MRRNGSEPVEEVIKELVKDRCGWSRVSLHCLCASVTVALVGSWTQADKRRQAVAQGKPIGPKAWGAAVTIGKWMDPYPLGMRPGAEIDNGRYLIGVRILPHGQ